MKKDKCSKCEKKAVIREKDILYCAPCWLDSFIEPVQLKQKSVRHKPNNDNNKTIH
tara:strand:+ start:328 stop:495 length:168 start_codon:yes stop_codon:yes gene_type:complete